MSLIDKVFECLETGKRSHFLLDILPRNLTLDPNYAGLRVRKPFTLFQETSLVPFRKLITENIQELFTAKIGSLKMNGSEFLSCLRQKLENIVMMNWKPELNHIIFHSSGKDSRIISWTIRNLFQKYGSNWLGRTVFLCSKWEGSVFKQIMEYEGWKRNQYLIIGEKLKGENIWAPVLLDFKNAWRRSNGTFVNALNFLTYFPEVAHRKLGFPLDNIQLWWGAWANELSTAAAGQYGGAGVRTACERFYPYPESSPPKEWQIVKPFADIDYLKFIVQSSVRLGRMLRPQLLILMDQQLARFPNLNKAGHTPWKHANFILKKALRDYRKSWYGRKVRPNAIWPEAGERKYESWRQIGEMTFYWTVASLCDYLLANGYKIRISK